MASDENVDDNSCIFDPNFAIVCSFFEKFSTLCGIQPPSFSMLQRMLEDTEEIAPQLIDLHIRLMRKARKNVSPDRWQRTLAKFCYYYEPDDCWILEQQGYKHLNYAQRLRILLTLIGAQFDHNVKFKSDVNKLNVKDLRLEPFGKDKDGNNYWVHMDSELALKVYKENVDDEKWELVAKDREDIKKLIEELMKGKDPNRQLEVVEDDEQSEIEEEENENEDLKCENDAAQFKEVKEGNMETVQNKSNTLQRKDNLQEEKDTLQKNESLVPKEEADQAKKNIDKIPKKSKDSLSSKPSITEQKDMNPCLTRESKNPDSIQVAVSKSNISDRRSNAVDQNSFELKRKDGDFEPNSKIINRESSSKITEVQKQSEEQGIQKITPLKNTSSTPFLAHLLKPKAKTVHTPIKPLDKEKFAEHLQKLDSENMLMPLLSSSAIDEETVASSLTDTLKSRISLKLNTIKPALQTGLVKSKLESIGKTAKPGLKLEQILKSKLAQKLAVSSTSEVKVNSENEDLAKLKESEGAIINSAVASQNTVKSECEPTDLSNKCYTNVVTTREKEDSVEVTKRKIEDDDIPEAKRARLKLDESEEEIEEPMMLVTGVGSGKECNTGNETEENTDKNSRPGHLTYKVDDILKNTAESDQNTEMPSTSGDAPPLLDLVEKKKPKLWTIDAICSSDSSKETKRDDVSLFPNYSFNKDSKMDNLLPYRSFFGLSDTKDDKDKDAHNIMPTNFYFGCNNQNPCFLPLEKNVNSFKPGKSHNVKDIVEDLDKTDSNYQSEDAKMVSHFSAENLSSSAKSSSLVHLSGGEDSKLENNKSLDEKDLLTNDEIMPALEQESEQEQSSSNQLGNSSAEMNTVNEVFDKVNQETIPNLKETTAEINGPNATAALRPLNENHEQATISLVGQDAENMSFDTSKSQRLEDDTTEDNPLVDVNCNQRELPTITAVNPSDSQILNMSEMDDISETSKKSAANNTVIVDNNSETIEKVELTENDAAVEEPQVIDLNTTISTTVIDTVSQIPYGNVNTTAATQIRLVEKQQPEIKVETGSQPTLSEVVNAAATEDSAVETEIEPTSKAMVTDNFISAESSPEKSSVDATTCSESATPDLENIKSEKTETTYVCETPKLDAEDTESTETTDAKSNNYENDEFKDSLVPVSQKEQPQEKISECEFTKADVDDVAIVECSNEIIEKKKKDKKSDVTPVTIRQSDRVTRGQGIRQFPTPEKTDAKTSKKGKLIDDEDEKEDSEVLDSKKSIRKGKPKDEAIVEEQNIEIKEEVSEILEMKKSRLEKNLSKEASSEKEKTEVLETRKITRRKKQKEEVNEKDETEMPEAKKTPNRKGKQKKEEGKNGKEMEIIEPKRTSLRISKKEEQCIKEETENLESRKPQRKGKQKKDTEEPENEEETIVKRRKNKKNSTSQKNVEDSEHEDEVTTKKRKNKKNDASKKDVTDESEHEVEATVKRKYCKKTDYSNGSNMNKKKAKHLKLAASVVNEDENVKEEPTVPTLKLKLKKGRPRLNKEENWEDVTNEKKTKSTKVESFAQEEDEQKGSDGCGQPTPSTKKVTKGRKKKAEKIKTAKARKKNKESSTENKCENEISTTDQTTSDAKPLNNNSEEDEILEKRIEKLKKISDEKVEEEEEMKKKKKTLKRGWMNEVDISNITPVTGPESSGIRQSRRIAQLKIKEQAETGKYVDTVTASKKSSLSNQKSKMATPTKKLNKFAKKSSKSKLSKEESDEELYYEKSSAKKKKKKKDGKPKKNFDPHKAWKGKQSSDSSSEEEEEEDHFEEEDDDIAVFDASDHEFSPESGIDDDEDYQPVKRARTAYSKPRTEDKPERDDLSCQRCGTAEQPEWILLCDVCDEGWHAACLKPPILAIPEGDWFCPPCQHNKLITNLQKFLKTYDKALNKKTNEELRRKRLEYVDISFSNIIVDQPIKKGERSQTSKVIESENSASSSDEESEEEEEEEPLYQLRVRRQMNVSHRLNEYEELMSSAIERDVNDGIFPKASAELHSSVSTPIAPDVLDTSLVSTAAAEEATADKDQEKNESIIDEESKEEVKKVAPVVLQLRNIRKKPPRLTNLDVSSEDDHYSDEDFKGSSAEELEDDDEYEKSESDSDDRAPVRRSTRARVTRYDNDFINDDSDEDDEQDNRSNRNKKKRVIYSESDSEEEDSTWGKRKRNKHSQSHRPAKKKRRRIQFDSDSDNDRKKKPKKTSRVTYGLDESDDNFSQRRTRGKKINYLENLGSDSEEETTSRTNNKFRKILSDDDDDYVDEEEQKQNTGDNIPHKIVDKKESINDLETCSEQVNLKGLTSDSAESVTNKSPTKIVTNELNLTLEKPICNNSSPIKITDKSPEQTRSVSNGNLEFSECQTNNIKSDDFEEKNTNSQNISKMDVPVFSGVVETDNKPLLKNIDTNPSLQGMQSMTQNLSQVTSSNSFSPASLSQDPKYSTLISGPSGPVPVNYADVGITYEDPEGASISPDDKYALPIRVVSPSKLYSIQEGPPINRPSLPPFASGPRIQEPPMQSLQGSVGILPTNANRPMPTAVPIRGTRPMSGTPVTVSSHVLPPSSVNVSQCGPPSISEASPKRRPRGRGKKQLEMERLQRERESMDINRTGDEMMPLHLLKVSPSEMNTVRPPLPFSSPSGQPPPPFNNYQRIPFSQAPPSSSQQQPSSCISINTGNSSKRVKITPVRMRMPNTSQNVMRFSRPPGSAGIYGSAHHSVDSSLSPTAGQDIAGDGKVTAPTSVPGSPVVSTVPVKSEPHMSHVGMKGGDCPPSEQYYLQPPYPPSQILRGYNARHEFPYSRKTVPNMYQQPHISSVSPTSGATVTTRASGFVNSKLPTVSSPNIKTEGSMTTVIKSPPVVPRPYSLPSHVPPSTSSVPTTTKISQNAPYVSSPSSSQSHSEAQGPPTSTPPSSAYQMLHMKSPQSSASTSLPYTPPYYTSSIMQSSYPVPSSQPSSISFSHSAPSNNYSNQLVGRTPIPQSSYKPEASSASPVSVGSSAECITATSSPSEYLTPTSQSNDFQYSENQQTVVAPSESDNSIEYDGSSFNESSTTYNEESQPAEETSTGEFGGLVSYFSSQREDDLDT